MVKRYSMSRSLVADGYYMAEDDETSGRPLFVKADDYECLQMELAGSQDRAKLLLDAKTHWADKARALAERCERLEGALREARAFISSEQWGMTGYMESEAVYEDASDLGQKIDAALGATP